MCMRPHNQGLGFTGLLIKGTDLANRMALILTLLLTAVSYKNQIVEFLPTCSYFTSLDRYVVNCIFALFGFAVESVIVHQLSKVTETVT